MSTRARYHVAVLRPGRRRLRGKPLPVLDYGRCTECGDPVASVEPVYENAREILLEGHIIVSGDDKVLYHILRPCAHTVDKFCWITQGWESIAVNDAISEEGRRA